MHSIPVEVTVAGRGELSGTTLQELAVLGSRTVGLSRAALDSLVREQDIYTIVGRHAETAVGFGIVQLPGPNQNENPVPGLLHYIGVRRNEQHRGIGGRILRQVVSIAAERGAPAVYVHPAGDQAAAFFTRHGFGPAPDSAEHLSMPLPEQSQNYYQG